MYPQRSVMTCGLATALEPPHFNHAPAWGATLTVFDRVRMMLVSIHAPAWGTTLRQTSGQRLDSCFNPRTRVGCDLRIDHHGALSSLFQSTHPRGVRPYRAVETWFNFHVSIHAPAWGATPVVLRSAPDP